MCCCCRGSWKNNNQSNELWKCPYLLSKINIFMCCKYCRILYQYVIVFRIYWDHCHVFTQIWERCFAWYQQAVIIGREMRAGRNLGCRIIKSGDYFHLIKTLIQSTEIFSVLTQWVVFYIVNYIMQSAMMPQWWLIYNVQCILDCFPVSVSTEPLYQRYIILFDSTVMTSLFTATRIHINCISVADRAWHAYVSHDQILDR